MKSKENRFRIKKSKEKDIYSITTQKSKVFIFDYHPKK